MDDLINQPSSHSAGAGFQLSLIGTKAAAYFDLHEKTVSVTDYGYGRSRTFRPRQLLFRDFNREKFKRPTDFNHASHSEIRERHDKHGRQGTMTPPFSHPQTTDPTRHHDHHTEIP